MPVAVVYNYTPNMHSALWVVIPYFIMIIAVAVVRKIEQDLRVEHDDSLLADQHSRERNPVADDVVVVVAVYVDRLSLNLRETTIVTTWLQDIGISRFTLASSSADWLKILIAGSLVFFLLAFLMKTAVKRRARTCKKQCYQSIPDIHEWLTHEFVTRKYLAIYRSEIIWDCEAPLEVGMKTFNIEFFQNNGEAHAITILDNLSIEIMNQGRQMRSAVKLGGVLLSRNRATVRFTVHLSDVYTIAIRIGKNHLPGSPFIKHFLPGPIDGKHSELVNYSSMLMCVEGDKLQLRVVPMDRYANHCLYSSESSNYVGFCIQLTKTCSGKQLSPSLDVQWNELTRDISLKLCVDQKGCYQALTTFCGKTLRNGEFTLLVLNKQDMTIANRAVAKRSENLYFKAQLVTSFGPTKKVFCYITPKQLIIKEFVLMVIPVPLFTFQVDTLTKFQFLERNYITDPVVVIDDGCQAPVVLATKDGILIAACFTNFLLKNIDDSYKTFEDKQEKFNRKIQERHSKSEWIRRVQIIKVSRQNLLETSMEATKYFSVTDWCKKFLIVFEGEEGIDWGGLSREWYELVCRQLFDGNKSGLFSPFSDDPQALVHPNRHRREGLTLEHYEFAGKIVGKCLYESSVGDRYTQLVNARFTQSFLAQLISLPVNYKYFERDDPELYTKKIKYIKENVVDDMELSFTEEEFKDGKLLKVHELTWNGAERQVTNENKHFYIDCLAEFRQRSSVCDEIDSFMRGLSLLIPTNFLSIFDENELELLLSGTDDYSVIDLKENHNVSGSNVQTRKVLRWFWEIVSDFTHHQMALLLQFTTGSSRLPPGGFSELNPKFDISFAAGCGRLPTAHTCFNQLCLPDYESKESMHQLLLKGINEGSQGFGFA